jgi:hypothetical protein
MTVTTDSLGTLSQLFGEYDELIADVKGREGSANWLADKGIFINEAFECEINDGDLYVRPDGEYLDFAIGCSLNESREEVPLSLGVCQVMRLRDLLNKFLASPAAAAAAAVKELEGSL